LRKKEPNFPGRGRDERAATILRSFSSRYQGVGNQHLSTIRFRLIDSHPPRAILHKP
jgi:hypothetical protein